jgi:hypothetical protein
MGSRSQTTEQRGLGSTSAYRKTVVLSDNCGRGRVLFNPPTVDMHDITKGPEGEPRCTSLPSADIRSLASAAVEYALLCLTAVTFTLLAFEFGLIIVVFVCLTYCALWLHWQRHPWFARRSKQVKISPRHRITPHASSAHFVVPYGELRMR